MFVVDWGRMEKLLAADDTPKGGEQRNRGFVVTYMNQFTSGRAVLDSGAGEAAAD